MGDLAGHIALISGALGDIGQAIARELASRGADLALGDIRTPIDAAPLVQELQAIGRRARYDRADTSDPESVAAWLEGAAGELGTPDRIIVNAAVVAVAGFRELSIAEWDREIRINLSGAFYMAQAAVLRMLEEQKPGRVVFLGSWVAHAPQSHIPAYCVSKAGLRMLCRCMARDLAPAGILVNEVAPGFVDAGLSAQVFREFPERREAAISQTPVGKLISPVEVAAQVAHLCSPTTQHLTGTTLLMDGGLSLNS